MIIEDIIQIWNPLLTKKTLKVKDFSSLKTKQTIINLIDTMRASDLIWIAAPQIGVSARIFVTELRDTPLRKQQDKDPLRVFINPQIVWKSKKTCIMYEWCGSVAYSKFFGPVKRPMRIIIEAVDEHGDKVHVKASWLLARVIQHEYDHLDGIVFIEKITDIKQCMSSEEYVRIRNKYSIA